MNLPAAILADVKSAIRTNGTAWPGGYPLYIVMGDGEPLSVKAAKQHWKLIVQDTIAGRGTWQAAGVEANFENTSLACCHNREPIKAVYAS